jgi:hypothetical protein
MQENKFKVLKEKIIFLIKTTLRETRFNVFNIDIDIETFIPQTTSVEEPKPMIERYDIILEFDYDGVIDSYGPHSFSKDMIKMFQILKEAVSQFTITQEGKIVRDNENINITEPLIISIDFKQEELHKFTVDFAFTYHE